MSDGTEVKIDLTSLKEEITATLKGNETINLKVNDKFTDEGVIVKEGTKTVTLDKKDLTTIIKNSKNETVKSIDTTKEETYIITYNISYKDFSKTLTRKVIIKKDKAD